MSIWGCENGHITGPGSEVACFVCGAPTSRVERTEIVNPEAPGLVIDDTDEYEACQ